MDDRTYQQLLDTRSRHPEVIADAARRRSGLSFERALQRGQLLIVAADHPGRGVVRVGDDASAMADRRELLERIVLALEHPAVDGLLGTPDIVEDLLLLGKLEDKIVIGSMNRAGLAGSAWELDDRFTAYDAAHIAGMGFEAGKMLVRIDLHDRDTVETLQRAADAVTELADRQLVAMIEPLPIVRDGDGNATVSQDPDALVRVISVASALGATSAYTWLKLPVVDDMERVMAAATLPALLLGGDPGRDADRVLSLWERTLKIESARGLLAGRSLLYPGDDDVTGALDRAASLLVRRP